MTVTRALLSVYDKTGLPALAAALAALGVELVATDGTARALESEGLPVRRVETLTGLPALLGGRVKTLHPAVFAGLLARDTAADEAELLAHGFLRFDLVVCNLYPFASATRSGAPDEDVLEQLDIGGVALLRAAAKNHDSVIVLSRPADYAGTVEALRAGGLSPAERRRLAAEAFRHTAAYDAGVADWMAGPSPDDGPLPASLHLVAERALVLRYGENPHQRAALYRWRDADPPFAQIQGKPLSYNNLLDLDAAVEAAADFEEPTVVIVKHTTPCGIASAETPVLAYRLALESDPVSAFGAVVAVNREVDLALAEALDALFVEVLAAPSLSPEAYAHLRRAKKSCRLLTVPPPGASEPLLRAVRGGVLVQTADRAPLAPERWTVPTRRAPTDAERAGLAFAWRAVKHVRSNAIAVVRGTATVGLGGGQPNRVDAARDAVRRAGERARGAVAASDGFFPFPDGLLVLAEAGVTACIEPGGSVRDPEVVAAADAAGVALVFAGERHFRH